MWLGFSNREGGMSFSEHVKCRFLLLCYLEDFFILSAICFTFYFILSAILYTSDSAGNGLYWDIYFLLHGTLVALSNWWSHCRRLKLIFWEIFERKTLFSVKIALIGLIPMLYCVNQDGVYYVFIHSQFVFATLVRSFYHI